jgi:hypothetical protein
MRSGCWMRIVPRRPPNFNPSPEDSVEIIVIGIFVGGVRYSALLGSVMFLAADNIQPVDQGLGRELPGLLVDLIKCPQTERSKIRIIITSI